MDQGSLVGRDVVVRFLVELHEAHLLQNLVEHQVLDGVR